jgi:hypothetical protein
VAIALLLEPEQYGFAVANAGPLPAFVRTILKVATQGRAVAWNEKNFLPGLQNMAGNDRLNIWCGAALKLDATTRNASNSKTMADAG